MRNTDHQTCNSTLNTQHTTVFLTHALLWPVPRVQIAVMAQKDAQEMRGKVKLGRQLYFVVIFILVKKCALS